MGWDFRDIFFFFPFLSLLPGGWETVETAHLFCLFPLKITGCLRLQGRRGSPGGENSRQTPSGHCQGRDPRSGAAGIGSGRGRGQGRRERQGTHPSAAPGGRALPGAGVVRVVRCRPECLGLSFSCSCWQKRPGAAGARSRLLPSLVRAGRHGERARLFCGVVCFGSINKCVIVNVQTHQSNNNGMKSKDYQSLLVTAE